MRLLARLGYGSRYIRAASSQRCIVPTATGSGCDPFTGTSTSLGCYLSPPATWRMITSIGVEVGSQRRSSGFDGSRHWNQPRWYELQAVQSCHTLSRDSLAKLWVEDKRDEKKRQKRAQKGLGGDVGEKIENPAAFSGGWYPFTAKRLVGVTSDSSHFAGSTEGPGLTTHELKYRASGTLENVHIVPGNVDLPQKSMLKLSEVFGRSDLLVTRDIEWANLMFAFEQESRYKIVDPQYPHAPIGSIHEQSNLIFRQLLRSRRPFIAYILDAYGNEIYRIRRPFWWINSTIYVEVDGKEIGVVHRRWHLWRRIYDLYVGNKQFAVVENPGFWNWTFTLKDENDMVLAEINRDWRGFGFELFTDAGQYVIRFGSGGSDLVPEEAKNVTNLQHSRPPTLLERAIAVALAVSLDCDYFSRHGGWGLPIFVVGE